MNWLRKTTICNLLLGSLAAAMMGCGVKGDPLPPEKPADLGRGRPTYKRATEEIIRQKGHPREIPPDEDKEDSENDN